MANLSGVSFVAKYNALFADNITRNIEESYLRELVLDLKDSFINNTDFVAPSASFGSITGNATDNSSINTLATNIINTVRGGVGVDYNTLKKLYDHFTAAIETVQEQITAIAGGDSTT